MLAQIAQISVRLRLYVNNSIIALTHFSESNDVKAIAVHSQSQMCANIGHTLRKAGTHTAITKTNTETMKTRDTATSAALAGAADAKSNNQSD